MAFTSMDRTLCSKLVTDFSNLINPITAAQDIVTDHAATLDSMLRSTVWSGTDVINGGIGTLNNTIQNSVPGNTSVDMKSLKTFLDNCAYLSGQNPIATILDASNGIFTLIDDTLSSLYTTIPEFGIGQIAGYINDILKGAGTLGGDVLSDIFKAADKLINCLSNLCGFYDPSYMPYVVSYGTQLSSFYTSMNIIGDPLDPKYGLFDYDTLYSNVGLTPSQISDMNLVINAIDNIKETSMTTVIASISSITELVDAGGFFTAIADDVLDDVLPGDLF
jgi:hypothetical protein